MRRMHVSYVKSRENSKFLIERYDLVVSVYADKVRFPVGLLKSL